MNKYYIKHNKKQINAIILSKSYYFVIIIYFCKYHSYIDIYHYLKL